MSATLLDRLKPDVWFQSLSVLPPPAILRRVLQRIPDVARVAWALRRGQITEEMVRQFVTATTTDWQRGQQLSGDVTLAALATGPATPRRRDPRRAGRRSRTLRPGVRG